jgi:hypothetical protein
METEDKKVLICGTGNRYMMKKAMKVETVVKKRKDVENMNLPAELFYREKQTEILSCLMSCDSAADALEKSAILSCKKLIDKKRASYKQQDLDKKRFSEKEFITHDEILGKMKECDLCCHYCKEDVALIYDVVRDMKQWTIDRINNDLGHTCANVVISCLECNLKRRRTNQDAFLFTKNLTIVKSE